MAIEIERKFLVAGDGWKAGVASERVIRQGYLARGRASIRVRIVDDAHAVLTIKSAGGKSARGSQTRQEFEYPLPRADADALLALADGHVIEKRRHIVPDAASGLAWEVDVFGGCLSGLVLAEIELDAADRALAPPDWIGREVTDDPRFYNEALSLASEAPDSCA